jgi:peptidoglycan hydrolase-like protein with peptidoglycan-binding domain
LASTPANPQSQKPHNPPSALLTKVKAVTADLYFVTYGKDVSTLQNFLISQKSGPAGRRLAARSATGVLGIMTKDALAEFQAKHGITPAKGYFGPKTRAYIQGM